MSNTYIPAELRRQVYALASSCCEYCKIPDSHTLMPHEIDHIFEIRH